MTPKSKKVPVEYIEQCFEYREEEVNGILQGNVYWKYREDKPHWWNGKHAGKKVGCLNSHGYLVTNMLYNELKYRLSIHTIVFVLNENKYPDNIIDHVDGNRTNNLFSNLEDSTISDNNNNRGATSKSASHFRGVHYQTRDIVWTVKVKVKGKTIGYGSFKDEIDAAIIANKALIENFGHTKNLRLNDISNGYTNKEYPNKPRGWKPE